MLFCVIGPSGCGKSTVVNELVKKGHKAPDSYTTRPQRYLNEGGHTYITEEEYDALEDKVAFTKFNGYHYCVTRSMLDGCDLYVVDPAGIDALKSNGYTEFKVIGLDLEPSDCAARMLARGDYGPDILSRLDNDWYIFRNFGDMCDLLVDATQDVNDIVAQIEKFIEENS